jgi:hypothetical protein
MMNEKANIGRSETDTLSVSFEEQERMTGRHFIGEVTDRITYPDGRVEVREGQNVVVNSISKLLACFIKDHAGYTDGNLYWAIGQGSTNWDGTPYTPVDTNTKLTSEVFRKAIAVRKFVDANGTETSAVTNRIELSVTLESAEANGYSLREFGIFGGNASGTKDSGLMVNHKTHSRIDKVEGMKIERSVRFTF